MLFKYCEPLKKCLFEIFTGGHIWSGSRISLRAKIYALPPTLAGRLGLLQKFSSRRGKRNIKKAGGYIKQGGEILGGSRKCFVMIGVTLIYGVY